MTTGVPAYSSISRSLKLSPTAMTSSGRGPNEDPIGSGSVTMLGLFMFVITTLFALKIISPANRHLTNRPALADFTRYSFRRHGDFTTVADYDIAAFLVPSNTTESYGNSPAITVRTVAFGSIPAEVQLQLRQRRDSDGLPIQLHHFRLQVRIIGIIGGDQVEATVAIEVCGRYRTGAGAGGKTSLCAEAAAAGVPCVASRIYGVIDAVDW